MGANQDALSTSVQYVKGVGPRRSQMLGRLEVNTVEDLVYFFPRFHEDRSRIGAIRDVVVGETATLRGKIRSCGVYTTKTGITLFQAKVGDASGVIHANWFHQPYLASQFKVGDEVVLSGRVVRYAQLTIANPDYDIVTGEDTTSLHMGRIVPIYRLTRDLSQKALRAIVYSALERYGRRVPDPLTPAIKQRHRLIDLASALRHIHFPKGQRHLESARRRLVFDEFFLLQLALALRRDQRDQEASGVRQVGGEEWIGELERHLPFELTQAQKRVMFQVQEDMARERPMNRLVQGDVGSGKTAVALFAALVSIRNGFQAALMVPTELLAEQHFLTLSRFLYPFGARVALMVQGLKPERLLETQQATRSGEADLVIGTHKLIQERTEFKRLGLVIVDEQHKFGVSQRGLLKAKGVSPDTLIMTATPIPRTLALTLYGDLDISVLDESPPGRGLVTTIWVEPDRREEIYTLVREELERGNNAFVVYPVIEEGKSDLAGARSGYEKMLALFSDYGVGLVHGQMKPDERDRVIRGFREGKIRMLVSTTVIEVGIDIPQASVMIVEHAERFGLSQLHQLRGRVGRSAIDSYCILIGECRTEAAVDRLNALVETADGFQIAEKDLAIRGPGEFFGTRQHGLPRLRIGNIATDLEAMEEARHEASQLVRTDPDLSHPEHQLLRGSLERYYYLGRSTHKVG